jgi:hypothetical protein
MIPYPIPPLHAITASSWHRRHRKDLVSSVRELTAAVHINHTSTRSGYHLVMSPCDKVAYVAAAERPDAVPYGRYRLFDNFLLDDAGI